MSIVSISEAARLVNKCRQTIYKHIRQGKLSTSTCVDGSKGLDISELIRVYGVLTIDKATNVDTNNNRQRTTKDTVDNIKSVDTNNSKLIELEKELALSKLRIEQQEKELHYKQTIIDNKQEIIDSKKITINAKQETIDSLKTALKLLEHRQEKTDTIEPTNKDNVSEPQKNGNSVDDNGNVGLIGRFKRFFR